jgi:hypothetical protein
MEPQERNGSWVWVTPAQDTGSARGAKLWGPGFSDDTADSESLKGERAEKTSREERLFAGEKTLKGNTPGTLEPEKRFRGPGGENR